MPNSTEWAVWAFACGALGLVLVPASTRLRPQELRYQLEQSDSVALILPGEAHGELLEVATEALELGGPGPEKLRLVVGAAPIDRPWITPYEPPEPVEIPDFAEPDDILLIQYTSGTTAFPKGAMLTHRAVLQDAVGVAERLHVDSERDRFLSPSPFHHVGGSTVLLYLGLVVGVPIYTTSAFDPERILRMIEEEAITMYGGIDSLWVMTTKSPAFRRERMATVRKGWIAATAGLFADMEKVTGVPGLVNLYGLSEASPNVTIADVGWSRDERVTCGRPHSGFEIRVVDHDTRTPLPPGTSGEIEVRGPCVMVGYYAKPRETSETIGPDGWLRTGDRGYLRPDGNLVYEGRYKHMLRVGGENVAAAEIEAALLTHPDIAEAAVIGLPHPTLGEVPGAAVIPKAGRSLTPEQITDHVAGLLASFKVPRSVRVVDQLPTTGSGRIQKFRIEHLFEMASPAG
jgi:acyl-CoA synthetase (AMP-forming)/AMP-acid ligase II